METETDSKSVDQPYSWEQFLLDFDTEQLTQVAPAPASELRPQRVLFDCSARFDELMSAQQLLATFARKFQTSTAKGIDRANGFTFAKRLNDLTHASRKCLDGTYRFSPYLEVLKTKDRNSKPRLVSIPTIRDRVVLHQLKTLLSEAFPECVPRSIAGGIVREIAADLADKPLDATFVAGCDIKQFYDTLHRDRLLTHLKRKITDPRAISLIEHSIVTPTVPQASRRRDHNKYSGTEGVPQGLSTSNILAAIYIDEIDQGMRKMPVRYFRYVDDVLIYGTEENVIKAQKSFIARARRRGLAVHKVGGGKSHLTSLSDEFRYLGYVFRGRSVTVRASTLERLLASLAEKFSDFKHNKQRRLERHRFLTLSRLKDIFLLELNERITGAVKDNKRYGWIAYFNQITDLSLLHRLDFIVRRMFQRLPEFDGTPPSNLKSFARAFFEMKFRPKGGYIRDFDSIKTLAEKLQFLVDRGRVGPTEKLSDEQINDRFDRYTNQILSEMQADEGNIY